MPSRRESMRYDFSQMGTDNERYKGVMKVGGKRLRDYAFSDLFSLSTFAQNQKCKRNGTIRNSRTAIPS